MLLCDIGNTTLHFFSEGSDYKVPAADFDPASVHENVWFISVNAALDERLALFENWHDLRAYVDFSRYYETMGIDRIAACEAVDEGVIIDAGSAVTVDVVRGGVHQGGFITPGIHAMAQAYTSVSPRLAYSFNFELDLDKMPKNSRDAVSYGYAGLLKAAVMRFEGPYYLTGGDAERFAALFASAQLRKQLLFEGMIKIMKKADLC